MVNLGKTSRNIFMILLGSFLLISVANAEIIASVDRNSIDFNESFVLEIKINKDTNLEPDFSILDKDFLRGQLSRYRNTSINKFAEAIHSQKWAVTLKAKKIGKQVIPAISIGSESSKPILITVNESRLLMPGEAEIFITSEVDFEEAYVQSQIIHRSKIYSSVATRQQVYSPPVITGADILIEKAAENQYYKASLNGQTYNVTEIVTAIYPQASGEIEILPAYFEARIINDGGITGRKLFESGAHKVKIFPIPRPPKAFPNANWLPALDIQLNQEWSQDPNYISVGEPFTRKITISALGQIETQIPTLLPQDIEGLNIYTNKPEFKRYFESEGIRGVRTEQFAMIAVDGGSIEIPELQLPWWNIKSKKWNIATLPSKKIKLDIPIIEKEVSAEQQYIDTEASAKKNNIDTSINETNWKIISQFLGILWVFTLFFGWFFYRRKQQKFVIKKSKEIPIYKRQAKLIRAAKKSATNGDRAGLRFALIEWAALQWPDKKPRSIAELAKYFEPPLSEELKILSANSYGNLTEKWDSRKMLTAINTLKLKKKDDDASIKKTLPPLMPSK
tara:strand:+ start:791 stop:2482 length:1692 start_codon:yes stop_codon:yes gene_type:complete